MADVYKILKGIRNLVTAKSTFVVGIDDEGTLTRTTGEELYKVGWTSELIELDHTTPNAEGTPIHFQTTNLQAGYERHIKQNYAYDNDSALPIGVIHSIGGNVNLSTDDWAALDNRRVIITAQDGCWFNIANNGSEVSTTKTKKILTQTNGNIEKCIKAVFSYDNDRNYWIVESYELLEDWQRYLFKRFTFSGSSTTTDKTFKLPDSGGLRFSGYYEINVFCEVAEFDVSMVRVSTTTPQSLSVAMTGVSFRLIDKSPNFVAGVVATDAKMFNNSLQGSWILEVVDADCADRTIDVKVSLPNGVNKSISNGYLTVKYLGSLEGNNCS